MSKVWVYRLYDAYDYLVWVGQTNNLQARWSRHANGTNDFQAYHRDEKKPWWSTVERAEATLYGSRSDAEEAEKQAIRDEDPLHNRQRPSPKSNVKPTTLGTRNYGRESIPQARSVTPPTMPDRPSTLGNPEADLAAAEFGKDLKALVEDILSKVRASRHDALRLWVREGFDAKDIAEHLGTTYGHARNHVSEAQKSLHPDEVASLRALRAYWHPDAKAPKPLKEGTPTALLDILAT